MRHSDLLPVQERIILMQPGNEPTPPMAPHNEASGFLIEDLHYGRELERAFRRNPTTNGATSQTAARGAQSHQAVLADLRLSKAMKTWPPRTVLRGDAMTSERFRKTGDPSTCLKATARIPPIRAGMAPKLRQRFPRAKSGKHYAT